MSESESGIQIRTRKAKASPHAVRSAYASTTIRNRSGGRRALGVAAKIAKRGYRPDLRQVSLVTESLPLAILLLATSFSLPVFFISTRRRKKHEVTLEEHAPPRARWTL